jgi:signal transduction histidine kinase
MAIHGNARNLHFLYLWALAAASLCLIGWNTLGFLHDRKEFTSVFYRQGEMLLLTVEGSIRSHRWAGRYNPSEMTRIFEEFVQDPLIVALTLESPEGRRLVAAGDIDIPLHPEAGKPEWISRNHLLISTETDLRMGRGSQYGRGPAFADQGDWEPLPAGICRIWAVLDAQSHNARMRRLAMRLIANNAVGLLFVGFLAFVLHITRRKADLEAQLVRTRSRAERMEMLSQLGAGLAHETRNPLGIIRGLAQGAAEGIGDESDWRSKAGRIVDEVDRTIGQINAFLEFSRPLDPSIECVDLQSLISEMIDLTLQDALNRSVEIKGMQQSGQEPLRALADLRMLRECLINLILNAIQACSPGASVEIGAERLPGKGIRIFVKDTGKGISKEDLPHVMDPYFTRREGGTGLGLSIVRQISEAHGWQFTIESDPGEGTRAVIQGMKQC